MFKLLIFTSSRPRSTSLCSSSRPLLFTYSAFPALNDLGPGPSEGAAGEAHFGDPGIHCVFGAWFGAVNGQDFRTHRDPLGRFTLFLISQLVSGCPAALTQGRAGPARVETAGRERG